MSDHDFHTSFSKQTWETFKSDQPPGPLQMLSRIRLRDHVGLRRSAAHLQGHRLTTNADRDISGPVFQQLGGKIAFRRGGHELTMVGPQ
jgi:hypothetical protein